MIKTKIKAFTAHNDKPNSRAFFKYHWIFWKMLGITLDFGNSQMGKILYVLYSLTANIMISICYPIHLAFELFRSDSMSDNIKNLAIFVTCLACSTKFFIYATKLRTIRKFEEILEQLDERIENQLEMDYYKRLRNRLRNIGIVFFCFYLPVGITAELSFLFREERSLLYPGRLPFDWSKSTLSFMLANVYQFGGIFFLLVQNFLDDTFPAMALCLLSGHIKVLSIRVARIGYDDKTLQENEEELNRCIKDQKRLYELSSTIENIISLPIFLQFFVSTANVCFAITALLFFVSAPMDILYYLAYCLAMQLQMFPTCYYGSDFQYQFDQLHHSVYESNWTEQTMKYKKHMILFTERSLKPNFAMAGGMVHIHLDTFFATCRGAYSLMAVVTTMN